MARLFSFLVLLVVIVWANADEKEEREKLEPYLRSIYRLASTNRPKISRIVSTDYNFDNTLNKKYLFVFDKILGAVLHAGYKTREVHLPKKEYVCPKLNKLYEYQNETNLQYVLTTNYLDVNNKGDRQPIGLCSAKPGKCGADVPLYEYRDKKSNQFYYGTSEENILGMDLEKVRVVCYIFARSPAQIEKEGQIVPNENIQIGAFDDKIVHYFGVRKSGYTYYAKRDELNDDQLTSRKARIAFNLIKPEFKDKFAGICELRAIAQYADESGKTVLFDDPERDGELRNLGFKPHPDEKSHILGYGLQKLNYCGSRIKYELRQDPSTKDVQASYFDAFGRYTKPFFNSYFYSI